MDYGIIDKIMSNDSHPVIYYMGEEWKQVYRDGDVIRGSGGYENEYFTIESLENGNKIFFNKETTESGGAKEVYVSRDKITWTKLITQRNYATYVDIDANEELYVKAIGKWMGSHINTRGNSICSSKPINVSGNILSLFFMDNFRGITSLETYQYSAFLGLFYTNSSEYRNIISAENLVLPSGTLPAYVFNYMFAGCSSLTKAPKLPSRRLGYGCYANMFRRCTSLTTAPDLPATTLKEDCYQQMFYGCTSLEKSPILAANTLEEGCYDGMFDGCSSLNEVTCLATSVHATSSATAAQYWLRGVADSGTFYKAASMDKWSTGISGIPSGWTVVDYTN